MKIAMVSLLMTLLALGVSELDGDTYSIASQLLLSNINSETRGTITKSESITLGFGTRASQLGYDIRYRYLVSGKEYTGSLVNYKGRDYDVLETLETYFFGSSVTVYYDSSAPHYAVLENTRVDFGIWAQFFIVFICVPLLTVFIMRCLQL